MTNFYLGLARGPADHESSSVINAISNGTINMGSAVVVSSPINPSETLPRVEESSASAITDEIYGIAVGGDTDGVYGDGTAALNDSNLATNAANKGVVVVTQGRCLARVESTIGINIGDPLGSSGAGAGNEGVLINTVGETTSPVIARALQAVPAGAGLHVIAVDVQREGAGGISEAQFQAFMIPQIELSSGTTTTYDIADGQFGDDPSQTVPFAGTIGRILVGHTATLGNGVVQIKTRPDGSGDDNDLPPVNFSNVTGVGTEIIEYNQSFNKDDSIQLIFGADGIVGTTYLRITIEVEYDLT